MQRLEVIKEKSIYTCKSPSVPSMTGYGGRTLHSTAVIISINEQRHLLTVAANMSSLICF